MYAPIRDGNRGGRGLFSWEDVRVMSYRDRECYLGSTACLGFLDKGGRWRKKDWWTKTDSSSSNPDQKSIQESDLNNIKQALGLTLKPKEKKPLSDKEKAALFKKTSASDSTLSAAGLGFSSVPDQDPSSPKPRREKLKSSHKKKHKKHREKHYN